MSDDSTVSDDSVVRDSVVIGESVVSGESVVAGSTVIGSRVIGAEIVGGLIERNTDYVVLNGITLHRTHDGGHRVNVLPWSGQLDEFEAGGGGRAIVEKFRDHLQKHDWSLEREGHA